MLKELPPDPCHPSQPLFREPPTQEPWQAGRANRRIRGPNRGTARSTEDDVFNERLSELRRQELDLPAAARAAGGRGGPQKVLDAAARQLKAPGCTSLITSRAPPLSPPPQTPPFHHPHPPPPRRSTSSTRTPPATLPSSSATGLAQRAIPTSCCRRAMRAALMGRTSPSPLTGWCTARQRPRSRSTPA